MHRPSRLHRVRHCLFAIVCAGSVGAAAEVQPETPAKPDSADSAQSATSLLAETLEPLRTFTAQFRQETRGATGGLKDSGTGELWLSHPDRFRIEIRGDYPETIVSDGADWWVYESDLMQAVVRDLAEYADQIPVLVLTSRPELLYERYSIDYYDVEQDRRAFVLTPRASGQMYASISMVFAGETPHALEVRSQVGETTRIEFTQASVNETLPPRAFVFDPPADADVVDERARVPDAD